MASIVFLGSFLAGSLLTLLIPVGLLIAILLWHTRAIIHIPADPAEIAPHAAGAAEAEGRPEGAEAASRTTRP
jgi:hypothetical protein